MYNLELLDPQPLFVVSVQEALEEPQQLQQEELTVQQQDDQVRLLAVLVSTICCCLQATLHMQLLLTMR